WKRPVELAVAAPDGPGLDGLFDSHQRSLVAGKAVLVDGGSDPQEEVEDAARAGAAAVVVYGTQLPAGGLGLDEAVDVPVVSVPFHAAQGALTASHKRQHPAISIRG